MQISFTKKSCERDFELHSTHAKSKTQKHLLFANTI